MTKPTRSYRTYVREIDDEYRRREDLARRAPRLHALIAEVEAALANVDDARKCEPLELWLLQLDYLRETARELTQERHASAQRELAAFLAQGRETTNKPLLAA